ncbi:uncharacterized protein LOC120326754 [Styela clava]
MNIYISVNNRCRGTKQRKQVTMVMSGSSLLFLLAAIAVTTSAAAKCRKLPMRPIEWTRLSGMWYNTFSHRGDPIQLEGLCNSMVIAGTKGYDGVAVVRNVMPETTANMGGEQVLASVPEFFTSLDPGVYKLDPSSQLKWMDIHELEKLMPKNRIASFMNAISKHYTNNFQITTGKGFFVIHQCDCSANQSSVWVYTTNPNPTEEETAYIRDHLATKRIDVDLQRNGACFDSLTYIYEKANGIKK